MILYFAYVHRLVATINVITSSRLIFFYHCLGNIVKSVGA